MNIENSLWKVIFFTLFTLIFLASCKKECDEANQNQIKIQFYNKSTLLTDTLAFEKVAGIKPDLSISDSVLYTQEDTLSVFILPISATRESVSYLFKRKLTNNLTVEKKITFNYKRKMAVLRPNCGVTERLSDLSIAQHDFDSVAVILNSFENDNKKINVQIRF